MHILIYTRHFGIKRVAQENAIVQYFKVRDIYQLHLHILHIFKDQEEEEEEIEKKLTQNTINLLDHATRLVSVTALIYGVYSRYNIATRLCFSSLFFISLLLLTLLLLLLSKLLLYLLYRCVCSYVCEIQRQFKQRDST